LRGSAPCWDSRDTWGHPWRSLTLPPLPPCGPPIGELDSARVRRWRAGLLADGVSATMAAKAYRLLRAVLMTAVDDGLIVRNPRRIRGAGSEPTPERPTLSVAQVFDLAAKVPTRYGALVLVATFASLRWGEATALRRCVMWTWNPAWSGFVLRWPKDQRGTRTGPSEVEGWRPFRHLADPDPGTARDAPGHVHRLCLGGPDLHQGQGCGPAAEQLQQASLMAGMCGVDRGAGTAFS
jgi:hypothetical protein